MIASCLNSPTGFSRRSFALVCVALLSLCAHAAAEDTSPFDPTLQAGALKQQALNALPPAISDGLDINGWGWFSYLHNSNPHNDITDTVLSLDITKSFAQCAAITFEGNLINADGYWRGEVERLYLSLRPSDDYEGIFTLGKFNTGFGLEERDFWQRTHGTTSLLFGAQPQDLVGAVASLPLADTGVKLRPFIGLDFQGQFEYNQAPVGGIQTLYKPVPELQLAWTGLIGPGMVVWPGRALRHPYPLAAYGSGEIAAIQTGRAPISGPCAAAHSFSPISMHDGSRATISRSESKGSSATPVQMSAMTDGGA